MRMSHTYAYTRMHSYIYTHIHTYMHTYMHTHMQTCTHDIYFIFLFRRPHAHGMIPGQPVHQPENSRPRPYNNLFNTKKPLPSTEITGHTFIYIHTYIYYRAPRSQATHSFIHTICITGCRSHKQHIHCHPSRAGSQECTTDILDRGKSMGTPVCHGRRSGLSSTP